MNQFHELRKPMNEMHGEELILTTEERSSDGGDDTEEIPHQTELMSVLAVGGEGVEDGGHDHADLVAPDDDEDDGEVLPGETARYWGWYEVPEEDGQEEDEAEEVGPDVERLVVEADNWPQALLPALIWPVPTNKLINLALSGFYLFQWWGEFEREMWHIFSPKLS